MVAAVRAGQSQRAVARQFGVPLSTVQFWCRRAGQHPLSQVDWRDRPSGPRTPANRTPLELEALIVQLRSELAHGDLGETGAAAIARGLHARGVAPLPHVRTIGRILERRGLLDRLRRPRRPPPPLGWYLPLVAAHVAELDSFDVIEGLKLKDGPLVEVLTGVSLHGGLATAWPRAASLTAAQIRTLLVEHWRTVGLPRYAQFDNDTLFQGPHQHRDVVSSVMRTCLSLGVTPVFVPPREPGFQAAIESFNGQWQPKVWHRFAHASLWELQACSARYLTAHRARTRERQERAPEREPFPPGWKLDLQQLPTGQLIYVRRTTAAGEAELLGRRFLVDPQWTGRLVRAEVDVPAGWVRFYQLRRRAPEAQPLLREVAYQLPQRRFRE